MSSPRQLESKESSKNTAHIAFTPCLENSWLIQDKLLPLPNNKLIYCYSSNDSTNIQLWDLSSSKPLLLKTDAIQEKDRIWSIGALSNNEFILKFGFDRYVVWDLQEGITISLSARHCISLSNGLIIRDNGTWNVDVVDINDKKSLKTLEPTGPYFSRSKTMIPLSENRVATMSPDQITWKGLKEVNRSPGKINIWEINHSDQKLIHSFPHEEKDINSQFLVLNSGYFVESLSISDHINIIDPSNGKIVSTMKITPSFFSCRNDYREIATALPNDNIFVVQQYREHGKKGEIIFGVLDARDVKKCKWLWKNKIVLKKDSREELIAHRILPNFDAVALLFSTGKVTIVSTINGNTDTLLKGEPDTFKLGKIDVLSDGRLIIIKRNFDNLSSLDIYDLPQCDLPYLQEYLKKCVIQIKENLSFTPPLIKIICGYANYSATLFNTVLNSEGSQQKENCQANRAQK